MKANRSVRVIGTLATLLISGCLPNGVLQVTDPSIRLMPATTNSPAPSGTPASAAPIASPAPAASTSPTASPSPSAPACTSVRHYTYPIAANSSLGLQCGADRFIHLIQASVPDRGRAVARVTLKLHNLGLAYNPTIHYWNDSVLVGESLAGFGAGDDVCPGAAVTKSNMGYGNLTDVNHTVSVPAYQGGSPCSDGMIQVESGSQLDVWVEDASPDCRGKDIAVASYYLQNGFSESAVWVWPTTTATMLNLPFTVLPEHSSVQVLGSVEATPRYNPNYDSTPYCQVTPIANLVVQTDVTGKSAFSTVFATPPPSQGMGHVMVMSDAQVPGADLLGNQTFRLRGGLNYTVSSPTTTGGCCGDAALAVIGHR